jgi:hypothetical protein
VHDVVSSFPRAKLGTQRQPGTPGRRQRHRKPLLCRCAGGHRLGRVGCWGRLGTPSPGHELGIGSCVVPYRSHVAKSTRSTVMHKLIGWFRFFIFQFILNSQKSVQTSKIHIKLYKHQKNCKNNFLNPYEQLYLEYLTILSILQFFCIKIHEAKTC